MIRYLPGLDHEKWYIIQAERAENRRWRWLGKGFWLHGPNCEAHLEWSLFTRGFGIGVQFGRNGGESDLGLNLYLGRIGSVWMRLRAPWTKWARVSKERDKYWYEARHTGIRLFSYRGSIVVIEFDSHDNGGPKREIKLSTWQLLGRTHTDTTDGDSGVTSIPMPEGVYVAEWTERIMTQRYVGWRLGRIRNAVLGPRVHRYIDLKIEGGIPIEGKGENSYDCGMDGLFGCGGRTVEEAIGAAVSHVLRDRRRYGGPHDLRRPMTVQEASDRSSSGE